MLTSLRFKNWRSLKDVEINDLTPITVFVGTNSSGKTNIFDGLRFMRSALNIGQNEAIYSMGGYYNIHTTNVTLEQGTEVSFQTLGIDERGRFSCNIDLAYDEETPLDMPHFKGPIQIRWNVPQEDTEAGTQAAKNLVDRWQILDEDFLPPTSVPANEIADLNFHIVDRKARNVPAMLDFLRNTKPDEFTKLLEDVAWLLDHVEKLDTARDKRETRITIYEKLLPEVEAPTISGGTARAIAMLTAMHVLNAFNPELPGLVAIEEPGTAIHPLLLHRLVEIFRYYVDVDEHGFYEGDGTNRRQIFLTTHNPNLLNHFHPREVRVVERDADGFTIVKPMREDVAKDFMEKHGLGEAWLTRFLGGVPE